jgi:hypothetical protein
MTGASQSCLAHVVIARMVTAIARAIPNTNASLFGPGFGAMSSERALHNFVETFPLFAAAVLTAHVAATYASRSWPFSPCSMCWSQSQPAPSDQRIFLHPSEFIANGVDSADRTVYDHLSFTQMAARSSLKRQTRATRNLKKEL